MKKKSVWMTALALLAFLVIALAAAGCIIYWQAAMYGNFKIQEPPAPDAPLPVLGEPFALDLECDLPWGQELTDVSFALPEGLLQTAPQQIRLESRSLYGRKLKVTLPVKSYLTGELPAPEAALVIERPHYKNGTPQTTHAMQLRPVRIAPRQLDTNSDLPLAGEISPPEKTEKPHPYRKTGMAVAIILMLLAAITAVVYYLKKRFRKNITPWDKALKEIADLRKSSAGAPDDLRTYIVSLSDILRDYLSKRFAWPANRQTSAEFIIMLSGHNHELAPEQIEFLQNFIQSADLIKFANFTPEMSSFITMLDNSEKLVNATIPQIENKTKPENKK